MSTQRPRSVMVSIRAVAELKELVQRIATERGDTLTDATMEGWLLYVAKHSRTSPR